MRRAPICSKACRICKRRHKIVGDVDGLGLALRMEICEPHDSFTPSKAIVDRMVDEALEGRSGGRRQEVRPRARHRRLLQERHHARAESDITTHEIDLGSRCWTSFSHAYRETERYACASSIWTRSGHGTPYLAGLIAAGEAECIDARDLAPRLADSRDAQRLA